MDSVWQCVSVTGYNVHPLEQMDRLGGGADNGGGWSCVKVGAYWSSLYFLLNFAVNLKLH